MIVLIIKKGHPLFFISERYVFCLIISDPMMSRHVLQSAILKAYETINDREIREPASMPAP